WALPGALWQLRPEACGLLTALNEQVWRSGDPVLLELVRVRVAQLIGNPAAVRDRCALAGTGVEAKLAALPDYPSSPLFSSAERDVVSLAEQFVIDVGGTTEDMRAELTGGFGADGARELVTAIYVVEFTQRLQLIAARLLGDAVAAPSGSVAAPADSLAAAADSLAAADASPAGLLDAYQAAVVRGSTLDPVTTELVRLRCARTHHCRICQPQRLAGARAAGVDEDMTAKVDFYERSDLPERAKVALRVTDAFITRPDLLSDAVGGQARASFGPGELASLSLDITKWSTQKIKVALGTDGADRLVTDADGVALFGFDSEGQAAGFRRR
ncbi:MAG TPA: carboxymuconolactone decarboxylase family protein, partial [Streptosporangiaceae bacterium]|nr:carboxymuconolactone decarboxylase family protein [Streptosporangiaceae bacterium]